MEALVRPGALGLGGPEELASGMSTSAIALDWAGADGISGSGKSKISARRDFNSRSILKVGFNFTKKAGMVDKSAEVYYVHLTMYNKKA